MQSKAKVFVASSNRLLRESIAPILTLVLLCCVAVRAQNQRPVPMATSELGQKNMSLVAASPGEIKAVLAKDAGLMVELKRWVAKDATDQGQIVSESDLTDSAMFDRLETDVRFRAVATLLLQRYGYLVPKVNPDSALGKEQELVVQERAKWLAQDQEERLTAARQRSSRNTEYTGECDPRLSADCNASQMPSSPAEGPGQRPQPGMPPSRSTPNQLNPPSVPQASGGRLERVQQMQDGDQFPSADSQDSLGVAYGSRQSSDSGVNPFGPLTPQAGANNTGDEFGSFLSAANSQGLNSAETPAMNGMPLAGGGELTQGVSPMSSGGQGPYLASGGSPMRPMNPRYQNQTLLQPVEMTRTRDPYGDIPSLYDMYMQATPHPSAPARFGIDVFKNGTRDAQLVPMDLPAGPDYVVGPGDGLAINLWGGVSQRLYRVVDREGRVSLPEVGPLLVSGKSLADVQQSLQQVLRTQFRDVSADVSLARLRTIRIYVVGDVTHPGAYDISSLSTPLNALFTAGGPTPRGSLRIVRHFRGNQLVQVVDLYDLLLHGVKSDIQRLDNGDTVLVPPIGPQVTVEGMVRRPAIYELKDEKDLAGVLDLAGGILPTAALHHIQVQRTVLHEQQTMVSLDIPDGEDASQTTQKLASFEIHDGDQIRLFPIAPYNQNAVYVEGHVIRPGRYSYRADMRVTDLISSFKDLLPEPATQYAEIIRLNAPDFHPGVEGFDLAEAFADPAHAPLLHPMDTVRIFSRYDFENPPVVSVWGDVRNPGTFRTSGQIHLSDAVHLAGGLSADAQTADAQVFRYLADGKLKIFSVGLGQALAGDPTENILLTPRDRVLIHRNPDAEQPATVYVQGEVGKPGRYPLTTNMTVADLIRVGGGLKPSADTRAGDLTLYQWADETKLTGKHQPIEIAAVLSGDPKANVPLHNGDVVTIRQLPGWNDLGASITVRGEVEHPGMYGIKPGERLSSVLARAGGFSGEAYPYGAVLMRREVRDLETRSRMELIERVKAEQLNLKALPEADADQKRAKLTAIAQTETALDQLETNAPIGRLVIRVQPDMKAWRNTAADVQMRDGDVLVIPKRATYVTVTGQVYNPTAISFRPGRSARWYLSQAGGLTQVADKKAVFVIRADGSVVAAKNNSSGWWMGGNPLSAALRPGDSIVVPEKAPNLGGHNWAALMQTAQIASSIALTIVAIKP